MSAKSYLKIKIYWKPAVWAVLILIASAISGEKIDRVKLIEIPYFDKFVHLFMYLVLVFLLLLAIREDKKRNNFSSKNLFWCFIITFLYSFLMEMLQRFVFVARSFEIPDLIANSIGILLGIVLIKRYPELFMRTN